MRRPPKRGEEGPLGLHGDLVEPRGGSAWSSIVSVAIGLKVPRPTWSVRSAVRTPTARDLPQEPGREMQPGGRRGDRDLAGPVGIDGLVALAVLPRAANRRRARCRAAAAHPRPGWPRRRPSSPPRTVKRTSTVPSPSSAGDVAGERAPGGDEDRADGEPAPRPHEALPDLPAVRRRPGVPEEQALDPAARSAAGRGAWREAPRRCCGRACRPPAGTGEARRTSGASRCATPGRPPAFASRRGGRRASAR